MPLKTEYDYSCHTFVGAFVRDGLQDCVCWTSEWGGMIDLWRGL